MLGWLQLSGFPVGVAVRYAREMAVNRFEMEGRADKAQKLARWMKREGVSAAVAGTWSEAQWALAMRESGVRGQTPSLKTQGMVVGLLTPSPVHESFYVGRHIDGEERDGDEADG
jgi:hypothetical protein